MGDDSPDQRDLVCPSCETEFTHESDDGRLPSVPCPECGEPTPVRAESSSSAPEGDSGDESGAGAESAPKAQVFRTSNDDGSGDQQRNAIDVPEQEDEDLDTGKTLMGVGARAIEPDEEEPADEGEDGGQETADSDGGQEGNDGTPLARIRTTSETNGDANGAEEEDTGTEEASSADEQTAGDETTDAGEATPERAFDAVADEDDDGDVHGRATSVSQKPLSELTGRDGSGDSAEADESDGADQEEEAAEGGESRLSALKQRLQNARNQGSDGENEPDDDNPFNNEGGTLGEQTQVASDPGFDEDEDFADADEAEAAVDVTVSEEHDDSEKVGDSEADGDEAATPPVDESAGDAIDWEETSADGGSDADMRDTTPAGEDQPPDELPEDLSGVSDDIEVEEESAPAESEVPAADEATLADAPAPTMITDAPDPADASSDPPPTPEEVGEAIPSDGETAEAPEDDESAETSDVGDGSSDSEADAELRDDPEETAEASESGETTADPAEDADATPSDSSDAAPAAAATMETGDTVEMYAADGVPSPEEAEIDDPEIEEMGRAMAEEAATIVRELREEGELGDQASDVIGKLREAEGVDDEDIDRLSRELGDVSSDVIEALRREAGLADEAAGAEDAIPEADETLERSADDLPSVPEPSEVSDASDADEISGAEADETIEGDVPVPTPSEISETEDVDQTGESPPPVDELDADEPTAVPSSSGEASETGGENDEWPEPVEEAEVDFPDSEVEETADDETSAGDARPEPAAASAEPDPSGVSAEPEPAAASAEPVGPSEDRAISNRGLLAIAGVGLVVTAGLLVVVLDPMGMFSSDEATGSTRAETTTSESSDGGGEKVRRTVAEASSLVHEALGVDVSDPELQRQVADRLADQGEVAAASRIYDVLWSSEADDSELADRYLVLLTKAGRYHRARHIALEAMSVADDPSSYEQTFRKAVESDEALHGYEPVDLGATDAYAGLRPASDIDFSGLVLTGPDGQPAGLFAPSQEGTNADERKWRDDVAAWRLCQIVACPFDIPRTRPARLSKSDFEKYLASDGGVDKSRLRWVDRSDGTYVYGALRAWPGEVVRWPIEEVDVWRPWLSVREDPERLETPAREAIKSFEDLGDGRLYRSLAREVDDQSVRELARQLSGVLAYDFLTNNWGRFEDDESRYGASHHFGDGRFVTMRTDTAFQRRKSTRVKGRFRWSSRFGRTMIRSIRLLEREQLRSILYPEPSVLEKHKFEIFWEQRRSLLDRVDELIDEHGRDRVLAFD